MTETTTETRTTTPADELRTAVTKLRKVAGADPLYGPLADLLEGAISVYLTHEVDGDYQTDHGYRWCNECNDEECGGLTQVDNALAVARAINGTAP